jgi:hypothetical protein
MVFRSAGLTIPGSMSSFDPTSVPPAIPTPVQALPYSIPVQYGRPGIVTAIGVMCIVVACLSGITSFVSGVESFAFYMMNKVSTMVARSAAVRSANAAAGQTASLSGSLSPGDVGIAVNSLKVMLSLDGPHVRELDHLLRLHGREIFGGDDDIRLTAASVTDDVSATQPQVANSPARFTTPQGTVVIYADRTSFTSTDGSVTIATSALHRSDRKTSTSSGSSVTTTNYAFHVSNGAATSSTLSPAEVKTVVAAVKSFNGTLSKGQLASLQKELAAPNQMLVTPLAFNPRITAAGPGTTPVLSVTVQPGGNAVIMFDTGNQLVLGTTGQVISSGPVFPTFNISLPLVVTLMAEAVASIALAIYLLVVGIQVFRASFRGRRPLMIYAWLKIPLALVAGGGLALLGYQFANGFASMPGLSDTSGSAGSMQATFTVWGCVIAFLGVAFPIGLLIALRSRTVKDYYNAVASGY